MTDNELVGCLRKGFEPYSNSGHRGRVGGWVGVWVGMCGRVGVGVGGAYVIMHMSPYGLPHA
jgi:hypothetical protein